MSSAIDFYNSLTKMNNKELLEYEDAINNDCRILTRRLVKYISVGLIADVLETITSEHEECFLNLLTIRSYIFDNTVCVLPTSVESIVKCRTK